MSVPCRAQWSKKVRARQLMTVPMARGHGLKKGLFITQIAQIPRAINDKESYTVRSGCDWKNRTNDSSQFYLNNIHIILLLVILRTNRQARKNHAIVK